MRGALVTLVSGPVGLKTPLGVKRIDIQSAEEMFQAICSELTSSDILIMAAAVADYTPESTADQKIKKSGDGMLLPLQRTKDILKYAGENKKDGQLICGFSMETEHLLENSRRKLQTKHCDMIAANSISESGAGFGVDTNRITLITENDMISLPLMSKDEVSHRILDELISMKNAKS